jgi:hypothetical protein
MKTYSLEELPAYETLSYTWGHSTPLHGIACNGHLLDVRENLRLALHQLRHSSSTRLFWIDALCINQNDLEERSSQIQHMRRIYQQASRVVVWLGETSETSSAGFQLLEEIFSAANSESSSDVGKPIKSEDLKVHGLPERSSPKWRALSAIFWREWFTRIWIIQETSVTRSVIVVCGTDQCSWSDMSTAVNYILDRSLDALTDVDPSRMIKLACCVTSSSTTG